MGFVWVANSATLAAFTGPRQRFEATGFSSSHWDSAPLKSYPIRRLRGARGRRRALHEHRAVIRLLTNLSGS